MIGADIVRIGRVARLLAKHPRRLPQRTLTEDERKAMMRRLPSSHPAFIAKRFAAKEALGKALGVGLRAPLLLSRIGVANDESGAPRFVADARLRDFLAKRGVRECRLSLSDDGGMALAVVILR